MSRAETVGEDVVHEVGGGFSHAEGVLDVGWHAVAHGVIFRGHGEGGLDVFLDDAVERGGLGPAVARGFGANDVRFPAREFNFEKRVEGQV